MRTIINLICVLIILVNLASCSNTIYFYETDKISLTAEARPDSSQPVQGNFGLKQRVALIVPPINSNCDEEVTSTNSKCNGEALSAIASFRFKKDPGGLFDVGPVSIKTAFITGKAASSNIGNAVDAATAIVGANKVVDTDGDIAIFSNIIGLIDKDTENPQAVNLLTQLNALGKTIIPDMYPVTIYEEINSQASGPSELKEKFKEKEPTTSTLTKDISGALKYLDQLDNASKLLKFVLETPNEYLFNGSTPNDPITIMGLKSALANTEVVTLKVRRELFNNPMYRETINFYTENYL